MAIERKLYNTYYYDRFYFSGQQLTKHTDREACEISVSIHINTNLEENWPIYFKTPDIYTDSSKKKMQQLLQMDKKINDEDFGACIKCRNTIPFGRLMIRPQSKFCVNCAQ